MEGEKERWREGGRRQARELKGEVERQGSKDGDRGKEGEKEQKRRRRREKRKEREENQERGMRVGSWGRGSKRLLGSGWLCRQSPSLLLRRKSGWWMQCHANQ